MKRKQEFETICGVRFARVPHMRRVYNMALGATIDAAEGGGFRLNGGGEFATIEEAARAGIARGIPALQRENYKTARKRWRTRGAADIWAQARDYAARGEYLARAPYDRPADIGGAWESVGERWRFVENPAAIGARFVAWADELAPRAIQHSGWYVDEDGSFSPLRAAVYQLPARDGRALYLAGIPDGENAADYPPAHQPTRLCVSTLFHGENGGADGCVDDDARDAALFGDSCAELMAEKERDYSAAYNAGARYADAGAEIAEERKGALALAAELRKARRAGAADYPAICAKIRADIAGAWRRIGALREKRAELRDGRDSCFYWSAHDSALVDAFNEGAANA